MPVVKTSISVDPKLLKRMKRLAVREGVSVSELFERFALQCLDVAERGAGVRNNAVTEALVAELLRPENLARAARIVGESAADPVAMRGDAAELGRIAGQLSKVQK